MIHQHSNLTFAVHVLKVFRRNAWLSSNMENQCSRKTTRTIFEDSVSSYGKKSYLRTLQLIKEKSSSTTPSHGNIDFDTEHTTILQYLKSQGFNAGRMPPNPVVADDMIMEN
ncbi:Protein CBG24997 [Caenorhabditis briggsae]|uniref:Protein CBG10598 n=2 Tax=Caenorhabditis briggsae TaxID=6238 RepID=G2J6A3_CAEBR|nr:Protein CBG10598 [Caenorhabditis briggsae]XP_002646017.2 Protein CBG10601 [Caenorhabditis briggsae]XP_002648647.2 Protein CBG24997 [Caenorhabditis briggsae]ULT85331.1 hypothetical protein L3Y34_013857 [Caenorhabditis briggsae]CAP21476.2 Protein CBG24997 [Caenorhabditis briggsae]CAP29973.1 Protein CBG10598 [Caenorhabditis briggsae]CAP29976.2 Protein CBG10601 [Caenorhabditis briggsae]